MFIPFHKLPAMDTRKPGVDACRPKPCRPKPCPPHYHSVLPLAMQLSECRDYDRLICLIRDLYPYMCESERRMLSQLIDLDCATRNARVYIQHDYTVDRGRPLSAIDRQKGLLKVLDKYARGQFAQTRHLLDLVGQIRKAGSDGAGAAMAAIAPMLGGSGPDMSNLLAMLNLMR